MSKKLYRSPSHKMIAGVCYGLAEYLDLDPTIVRLVFVALAMITAVFPMFIFYVIAWIIIPIEEAGGKSQAEPSRTQTEPARPKATRPASVKKKT